ncbi:PEGA domain-containing protein [Methanoculleus sp. FWC-SCC1]|uniref:PEGA domain-containing protein n=1 Tax=Methanoculleus frigidifontis TaxID=2584085 RepID=A0ABT8MCD7_9EURY|nr:PEGA domain-containing protein [Methanoculleus sp. FWC-SCC1]MDN7025602.1 PEGA domain-containing protein [Methanoculleus sp. FWC-SCC1]
MQIRSVSLLSALMLLCILIPGNACAATTEVHVLRYAADGVTVLAETTVDYRWMEENLPVLGDGETHYYHQGPIFSGDPWNPAEDTNVREKDMGAVKGTNLADLCDLVGGMAAEETVRVKASDGFSKTFPYRNVYRPEPRQGPMVVAWYRADAGYVPMYREGMRLVFFADTSVNPWGIHAFGVADMQACFDPDYWYFFQPDIPTTTGLSAQYISEIAVFSNEEASGTLEVESSPAGALVYLDDENTGFLTPCTIRDLTVGSHAVRVEKDGYGETREQWIYLKALATERVSFDLLPLQGSIAVSSLPAGAAIILDGNETGTVTDTTLEGVSVGEHTLLLVLEGYENATLAVTVEAEETAAADMALIPLNGSEPLPAISAATTTPHATTPAAAAATATPAPAVTVSAPPAGPFDPFFALIRAVVSFITGAPAANEPAIAAQGSEPEPPAESGQPTVTATPTITPEKVRANRSGGLYIDSFPQGALITIDNTRIAARTPHVVYGLREGLHSITLEYEDASSVGQEEAGVRYGIRRAWVYPDAVTPVRIDGVGNRRLRSITIESPDRAGAAFTVNGAYPPHSLPATVDIEGSGAWITIREGAVYRSISVPETLADGSRFTVAPGEGGAYAVTAVSDPPGAGIFVDGYPTDAATPAVVGNLSSGKHRITVSLPGYLPAEGEILIPPGAPAGAAGTVRSTLTEYPCGSLSVNSTPQGAKIYLYSRYTGETTPHTFSWMRIGAYDMKVVGETESRTIENVVVTPGTAVECTVTLETA